MWQVAAAANGAVMVAYSLIAAAILRPLVRTGQVRTNALGTATALIFFTCAVHHGSHTFHLLAPYAGWEVTEGLALRRAMGWHAAAWDSLSAVVGVYYWSLRRSYGALLHRGPVLFADLKERQRRALEINDNIVQGLTLAQYRYEAGRPEQAHEAVVKTLAAARKMMSDLVDPAAGAPVAPGDLVRSVPAQPAVGPDDRAVSGV